MISQTRKRELEQIADNELRHRGLNSGVSYLKTAYVIWELTTEEAEAVSFLIRNAKIVTPPFPYHLV